MGEVLRGLGVAPGVALGRVLRVETEAVPELPEPVAAEEVDGEIERLEAARRRARSELHALKERVLHSLGDSYGGMFDAQLLILDDPSLVRETEGKVRRERVSASWALASTVTAYLGRFAAIDDPHFQDRGGDLRDVHRRLQAILRERALPAAEPGRPAIAVAHSLGPAETIGLARGGILGIATDLGGPTSHLAILSQALGVPAVVGLGDVSRRVRPGDEIVLDGSTGIVEIRPGEDERKDALRRREAWRAREAAAIEAAREPVLTRDGLAVTIRANIEFPEEAAFAARFGAEGVGLYRSEFLFLSRAPDLPSEDEHYRAYREVVEKSAPHPAVIRTFDLGGEKYFHQVLERGEPNPVLGLRAIRLCLKRDEIFRPQIRGLLRAAAHGDLRLLVPLVSTAGEIREVRRVVIEEAGELARKGVPHRGDVPVGIMIETPGAALAADLLAREADFFSIGTNDLIQYALAVDRGNPSVSYLYDPLHPAVVRMLRGVAEAADSEGIPLTLCGEMAADPGYTALLVGLGIRDLSVPPRALPEVRGAVRALDGARAREDVTRALSGRTSAEVRDALAAMARRS